MWYDISTAVLILNCNFSVPVTDLGVVSGENYADRGHFLINVLFLVIHEDFDRTTLNADLALITTIRDIEFR